MIVSIFVSAFVFVFIMRFFLFLSLFSAAIAIAEVLFSTDPPPLDESPLLFDGPDEYESTSNLGGSDPPLSFSPIANSDSSQFELSSCRSENSDAVSWSKVRARRDGLCDSPQQSAPVKDSIWDGAARLGQSVLDKLGLGPMDEEEDDPSHFNSLIDNWKCQPSYPHNLCCDNKEFFTLPTFMGPEVTLYYNFCSKCKLFLMLFFWKFISTNWFINTAASCLRFDVCCQSVRTETMLRYTGVACYELSRPIRQPPG